MFEREDRRLKVRMKEKLAVFCSNLDEKSGECITLEGITENLSASGMGFVSTGRFADGKSVQIELYQPFDLRKENIRSIFIIGKVVWAKSIVMIDSMALKDGYVMGIEFIDGNQKELDVIEYYINNVQGYSRESMLKVW